VAARAGAPDGGPAEDAEEDNEEENAMTTRTKKMPPATRARRSTRRAAANAGQAVDRMRATWGAAVGAFTAAEEEMARQLRDLLRRNRITAGDASAALAGLTARLARERKSLGRTLDGALHGALASLDIPSRREVADLTRKVEQLTDRLATPAPARRRRPARRKTA
jgi:polyhydroxyalkanoate synthesis regulator phasin